MITHTLETLRSINVYLGLVAFMLSVYVAVVEIGRRTIIYWRLLVVLLGFPLGVSLGSAQSSYQHNKVGPVTVFFFVLYVMLVGVCLDIIRSPKRGAEQDDGWGDTVGHGGTGECETR